LLSPNYQTPSFFIFLFYVGITSKFWRNCKDFNIESEIPSSNWLGI